MALCNLPSHQGRREISRYRVLYRDGQLIEGCYQCTDHMVGHLSTEKQTRVLPDGKTFSISPAHVWDIKHRRVAPDLSHTWNDKKGLGSKMRY